MKAGRPSAAGTTGVHADTHPQGQRERRGGGDKPEDDVDEGGVERSETLCEVCEAPAEVGDGDSVGAAGSSLVAQSDPCSARAATAWETFAHG